MKQFNGERLRSARLYRGLTIEELAGKLEVTKQTVSQYENCKIDTPFEKILVLSQELGFPYEYFLQQDNFQMKTGSTYFRALLKTNKKYRVEQVTRMEHLAIIYSILKEYIEFPALHLPEPKTYTSPTEAAYALRNFWGLMNKPLSDMIRLLEENGIIVTMFPTSTDDIDAFSQLIKIDGHDVYFVAMSKNKDTAARIHFDIAHELGHLMLHEWSEDVETLSREQFKKREKEANEFAAAFLMPEEPFLHDIVTYPTNLDYYVQMKKKWKVSIAAMLYRSCDLGIINQNSYQYLMRTMQKKDWRKSEPLDNVLQTAKPSLLSDSVDALLLNGVFTPSEFLKMLASEGLAMLREEVESLLNLPTETLISQPVTNRKIIMLKSDLQHQE
jgi:Zn-dependent peptidase ImmA (M78 family)